MAEDESRTESTTVNEAAGSSSKDGPDERDEGWLQLSIGIGNHDNKLDQANNIPAVPSRTSSGGRLMELDLLPASTRSYAPIFHVPDQFQGAPRPVTNMAAAATSTTTPSFFLQQAGTSSTTYPHQEINWGLGPIPRNITAAPSSSLMRPGSYFTRPFQLHAGLEGAGGPSLDFRAIDPPRRPHSGIWFVLQASQNQEREPFLPQIPKSYLRIKDGGMTVQLLMKYLVNKLRLQNESEIEITCRGQRLLPFLTLQHVRDNIWSPRDALTLLADSSTTDYVMLLHYGRTA
ncbi:hypothetical protein F0562_032241 [Nyssa sinensis]|uniref:Uncharacterized protein n=1 Tax=Nyssa sinensis TaxID=561372 RepID=A0A5J5APU3_9ASTE|nr:hypothetical protein F0562_032241 [Nyssa sinensis]